MSRSIVAPLAGALLVMSLLVASARAQDESRCVGGQTPGGVIIVLFDRGQSILNARAQREIAGIAKKAIAQKAYLLCLEGFADASGGTARDLDLARMRAEAVADELAVHGYPRDKIFIRKLTDPTRLTRRESSTERKVEIRYGR
jgi:outer membrane protein OmpA-like peptidoglycan-associated protein